MVITMGVLIIGLLSALHGSSNLTVRHLRGPGSIARGADVGLGQVPGTGSTLATISVLVMNEASRSRGVPAVDSTSSQEVAK
jgi:hypothetical protein